MKKRKETAAAKQCSDGQCGRTGGYTGCGKKK